MTTEPRHRRVLLGPVAVNGFPARRLTKSNYDGGEWVTAYQVEQRNRLRTVFRGYRQSHEAGSRYDLLRPPTNTREDSGATRRVLDKAFLMRHCFVEQPTDLSDGDISGVDLTTYKPDGFAEFDNLVHVNASDSKLPMEAFKSFPALEQLELLVCGITDISISNKGFTKLQFLDLSHNCVSETAVLALGTLQLLTELHLTGNNIVALPVEMSRPFRIQKNSSDMGTSLRMRFASLEKLWLDDNKLTDQTTFATLAGLRKLKYVNLDNNELYTVPQLELVGTSPLKSPADSRGLPIPPTRQSLTPRLRRATPRKSRALSAGWKRTELREVNREVKLGADNSSDIPPEQEKVQVVESMDSKGRGRDCEGRERDSEGREKDSKGRGRDCEGRGRDSEGREKDSEGRGREETGDDKTKEEASELERTQQPAVNEMPAPLSSLPPSMAPFPHLHTLSLANNLFFSSEDLAACGSWPSLKEMIIHGNPLISMCKGMPPRLQIELVQKCGIKIVRHKPSARVPFRIGKKAREFRKVSSELPTVPRQLSLPPLQHPPLMITHPPSPSPLSPISHLTPPTTTDTTNSTTTEETLSGGTDPEDGVFITQGTCEQDDIAPENTKTCDGVRGDCEEGRGDYEKERSVLQREMRGWRRGLRAKYAAVELPEHFRGYEVLLEEDRVPTAPTPTDLYGCIHALRYALKQTSPSFKTAPSIHTHRQRKMDNQSLKLSTAVETATHHKVQKMQRELKDIWSSAAVLEANLADVLQMDRSTSRGESRGKTSQLQKEGKHLLQKLQAKYEDVQMDCTELVPPEQNHTH